MERKLVTIRRIKDLLPIKDADRIQLAIVDGWKTIVQKGAFNVGDYGIYFEIDSLLNLDDERFSFIQTTKTMDGVKSRYLRTIRLRGEISQGLIMPISSIEEIDSIVNGQPENFLDHDFADSIGVIKYEEPDNDPSGEKMSSFPFYIEKTGEDRIQNVYEKLKERYEDVEFYPTLKMDGSSMTVCYVNNPAYFIGQDGIDRFENMKEQTWVASHRQVIRKPQPDPETGILRKNAFYDTYEKSGLADKLADWCIKNSKQIAIQGELLGPKIQKNYEKFEKNTFRAFYVYFIDEARRATPAEFDKICKELDIETVKIYEPIKVFKVFNSVDEILKFAEGISEQGVEREGLVFKANVLDESGRPISFKVISNKYLVNKK